MTVDEHIMRARLDVCFRFAADVERWPEILPHYRWVRFQRADSFAHGRVEMAAFRSFGPLRYPVWWVSEMTADPNRPAVYYRHVDGITRGMDVVWEFHERGNDTHVRITHEWSGPAWPLIGSFAAEQVIGPHFISAVARRTLAGVALAAERKSEESRRAKRSQT
jgi:ribosome-associated toxin RatA of RatAB toxin-antitoxin module